MEREEVELHICRHLDPTLTYCGRDSVRAAAVNFSEFRRARGPFCADCYRWAVLADAKCAIREAFELCMPLAPTDDQVYKIVGALERAGLLKGQAKAPRSRWDAFSDEEIADLASIISAADESYDISKVCERFGAEIEAERDHRETRLP